MRYIFTSLTRISDLTNSEIAIEQIDRADWATGDYVLGEVYGATSALYRVELSSGRMMPVAEGDLIVGAFGKRAATLESTGDWEAIRADGKMEALTGAGLFGRCLSRSSLLLKLLELVYRGHVTVGGAKVGMSDYVTTVPERAFERPVILLIGSSMSAGKTTTARVFIRLLKRMDLRVIGAKLTGAGRYRDVLSMYDAGADHIFDFVDQGLPSTICDKGTYLSAMRQLLSKMAGVPSDVAVIEAGASPLEPYNGQAAFELLRKNIRMVVLCASDPYAVLGVNQAFGHHADLVTGLATNTKAGIDLIQRLSGTEAINVLDKRSLPRLARLLQSQLDDAEATVRRIERASKWRAI